MCSVHKRKLPEDSTFFDGCKIFILPSALGQKRLALLKKQILKYGGHVVSELSNQIVSHVVVDETMLADAANCLAVIKKAGCDLSANPGIKVLGTQWLTKCLKENQLHDTRAYELVLSLPTVEENLQHEATQADTSEKPSHSSEQGDLSAVVCESPPLKKPNTGSEVD